MWLLLQETGVAPTNNHAERMLRFAGRWRKRSLGTRNESGERWAECSVEDIPISHGFKRPKA